MGSVLRSAVLAVLLVLANSTSGLAQGVSPELRAVRADVPPELDGLLDDLVWAGPPLGSETWVSYNPLRCEPGQLPTRAWIAYDDDAIYFAFRCFDPDPARSRTTITRRDNV